MTIQLTAAHLTGGTHPRAPIPEGSRADLRVDLAPLLYPHELANGARAVSQLVEGCRTRQGRFVDMTVSAPARGPETIRVTVTVYGAAETPREIIVPVVVAAEPV